MRVVFGVRVKPAVVLPVDGWWVIWWHVEGLWPMCWQWFAVGVICWCVGRARLLNAVCPWARVVPCGDGGFGWGSVGECDYSYSVRIAVKGCTMGGKVGHVIQPMEPRMPEAWEMQFVCMNCACVEWREAKSDHFRKRQGTKITPLLAESARFTQHGSCFVSFVWITLFDQAKKLGVKIWQLTLFSLGCVST